MFIYLMNFYLILLDMYLFSMFLYFYMNQIIIYMEFNLMNIYSMKMEFLILIDWMSLLFLSIVFFISVMVIFYSLEYMCNDLNISRFILMIYLFIFSMMLMILSPNLISILLGWDGLGLVSYCLVIYYQSKSSFNSGMVTILMNRLGDILILMSIGLMMMYGSWNYMFLNKLNNFIYLMLMLASFTKSAQVPFSSWLPMAMAAPTPVSSLVHSSTLVTAGIYLLIRLNYLLEMNLLMKFLMMISLITMFMSGLSANFEFDFKKIIALSTLSQLGLMIFCLSMKLKEICFFHLLMHALFKSMLFMCAGVVIHQMMSIQDIRLISMTLFNLPMISMMFNCASLSLCGIPFLSGFFSKDLILELYMMSVYNKFIFNTLFISMGFTIMYTFRMIFYSFIKIPQLVIYLNYNSWKTYMGVSMYLLFFFSIFFGLILSWIMFSEKNIIFLTIKFKLLIYIYMIMGIFIGMIMPKLFFKKKIKLYLNNLIIFNSMMWFMPFMYMYWLPKIMKFSEKMIFYLDLGWIEYFLGVSLMKFLMKIFKMDFFFKNFYNLLIVFMLVVMILIY